MKSKKRILVAPLDWGIGHATRCIPLIKALMQHNFEVVLAVDGRPMHLLMDEFPKLEVIRLAGYNIKYPSYIPMSLSMILQSPKILAKIKKEHLQLESIIKDYNIDGVISDNRFGLHTKQVPCVFITHQLQIQSPYFTDSIQKFNYKYINKFDACWVMDNELKPLAPALSSPKSLPNNTHYIGAQSRFEKMDLEQKYDLLALVSGPEPQRTMLEKGLTNALKDRPEKSLIVLGKPELNNSKQLKNLSIKSHLNAKELNTAIEQSALVICRPGYSTIMDLAKLEKNAIFIPTPGQTEQEYLANNFSEHNICFTQTQADFNFEVALKESKNYKGFSKEINSNTNWESLFCLFEGK